MRCTSYTPRFSLGMDVTVNSTRRTSITAGTLLVVATVAVLAAAQLVDPVLTNGNPSADVAGHPLRIAAGGLFYLIAAAGSAGIGISVYGVLKKTNAAVALGSVVFRALEASLYVVAVVALLGVQTLARQTGIGHSTDQTSIRAVGDALLSMREHATLAGVFAFTLGAGMYYVLFYRSRLVPRWLSAWGLVGVAAMLTACLLALFSDRPITGFTLLILPIAVQEIVLAVWLLAKGFSLSTLPATATSEDPTATRNISRAAAPMG
jgi:hypothetical protein